MQSDSEQTRLTVNGKAVAIAPGTTVGALLLGKGLHARMVIVELNGAILARTAYATTQLRDGDRVEVVHAVGGG